MKKYLLPFIILAVLLGFQNTGHSQWAGIENYITFRQQANKPPSPGAIYNRFYFKSDGVYYVNSAGTETKISSTTIATDTIFDAKGDLVVGTGADTAARLAAGADQSLLYYLSTEATGLKALAPVNNGIVGYNATGVLGAYTNTASDDSSYHVYHTGAGTTRLHFNLEGMTATKTFTLWPIATDNYFLKLRISADSDITLPTTGTVATTAIIASSISDSDTTHSPDGNSVFDALAGKIGGTLGATTNVIPKSSGTGAVTLQASGITEDGTNVDLGALNLLTTGAIWGGLKGYLLAADSTIATTQAFGSMLYLATSSVVALPTGKPGMTIAVRTTTATNPVLKPAATGVISNAATNYTAGSGIKNTSATIGNYVTLHNLEGTTWYVWGANGTWTQGDI